jgi:hypothetical protein
MSGQKNVPNHGRDDVWKAKTTGIVLTLENKILYLQYTNPAAYPPLEHNSRILANEGWQVLFLGNTRAALMAGLWATIRYRDKETLFQVG